MPIQIRIGPPVLTINQGSTIMVTDQRGQIASRSDFAGLFEVKSQKLVRRGRIVTHWDEGAGELANTYVHKDFVRRFFYRVRQAGSPPRYANGRIMFEVALPPGASWHTCGFYVLVEGERVRDPLHGCYAGQDGKTALDQLQAEWRALATQVASANED